MFISKGSQQILREWKRKTFWLLRIHQRPKSDLWCVSSNSIAKSCFLLHTLWSELFCTVFRFRTENPLIFWRKIRYKRISAGINERKRRSQMFMFQTETNQERVVGIFQVPMRGNSSKRILPNYWNINIPLLDIK